MSEAVEKIETYFDRCDGMEFFRLGRESTISVIRPLAVDSPVLIAQKQHSIVYSMSEIGEPPPFGLIVRPGLPDRDDLNWILPFVGSRQLLFLGDLDPPELLTFVWWRSQLAPLVIDYLGVSDSLCERMGIVVPRTFEIPMAPEETAAMPLLGEVMPDWPDIVGARFAEVLRAGRKVEIEALISASSSPADIARSVCSRRA